MLGKEPWTDFIRFRDAEVIGESFECWSNNYYTVLKRKHPPIPGWPDLIHLSIRRNDRQVIDDWRDKQRIKNLLVGPENEALELFPANSRCVDSANQFHIWVFASSEIRMPFGFQDRLVSEGISVQVEGGSASQQRPFDDDKTTAKRISGAKMKWIKSLIL